MKAMPLAPSAAVAILCGLAPAIALAQAPPDVAQRYCATCHEVTPGVAPRNPGAGAPTFQSIADNPRKGSTRHLSHMLSQKHASMPPFALTASERSSLITYIQSLKTRPD